jgi:hypothetical protein
MPRIALRPGAPLGALAAVLVGLAGLTCVYPTDRSSEVYVSVTSSDPLVLSDSLVVLGTQATLTAGAWQRLASGDSAPVPNIEFAWSSANTATATVQGQEGSTAKLAGIAAGRTTITVAAVAFQGSKPATFPLRISTPFAIDSIRADTAGYSPAATFNGDLTHRTVKYGQLLTFYGVGTRGIFFASLGNALLLPDTFSFKGVPAGVGQMSFWVPLPAQTGSPVALALGGNLFSPDTIRVLRRDIYQVSRPQDTLPRGVSLDGPGPIPQFPGLIFFNPALAFEDLGRDTLGADWYRFTRTDTAASITLLVTSQDVGNLSRFLLSDSIGYLSSTKTHAIGPSAWSIGPGEYDCLGKRFLPAQSAPDTVIIALKGMPSPHLHLLSLYTTPGTYSLAIVDAYVHDPKIGPDRFTPNNTCDLARANFLDPTRTITVAPAPGFRDSTLTIDNPHAVDWYRFDVTGVAAQMVTIVSRPLPLATADSSAIDVYVLSDSVAQLGKAVATVSGAWDTLTVLLNPGQYYLAVVDFAGVPTRYSLCIVSGLACSAPAATAPFPVAPAARLRELVPSRGPATSPRAARGHPPAKRMPWRR